ncbi:hypothetical protein Fmac_031024 [Flemingia macrophylla]|uniref:Uncharacterized protein n=1 Tax=Flemingia macrophylla TaxID=520843 RepID=A0ABD1L1B5_9FABA
MVVKSSSYPSQSILLNLKECQSIQCIRNQGQFYDNAKTCVGDSKLVRIRNQILGIGVDLVSNQLLLI